MSIPKECKRLAEVDFALSAVNDACVEENNRKTRVDIFPSCIRGGQGGLWLHAGHCS